MKTDDLIATLAKDARASGPSVTALLAGGVAVAIVLAAVAFFGMLGPRADIHVAASTPRFLLKFVITATLALTALAAASALSRPQAGSRVLGLLLAAPIMLAVAVMSEMMLVPAPDWPARWIGNNNMQCLVFIPLIGLAPLAVLLAAMRRGAPASPRLAGAVAGLLAGGIAATFYAAHCTDDSPLFVATWYSIAILALAGLGALAGGRALRW
jgi:hypothetical protein